MGDKQDTLFLYHATYDQCGGCSVTDPCNACTERQIRMENMLEECRSEGSGDLKIYNVLYSFYRNNLTKARNGSCQRTGRDDLPCSFAAPCRCQDEVESKLLSAGRRNLAEKAGI